MSRLFTPFACNEARVPQRTIDHRLDHRSMADVRGTERRDGERGGVFVCARVWVIM